MALFVPLLGQMSGSVAGNVFSRNRSGAYVRQRAIPVNPNTGPQNVARASLALFSGEWSERLNDAHRASWDVYAANTPLVNRLGVTYFMTGHQAYVRTNTFAIASGGLSRLFAPFLNGESATPGIDAVGAVVVHDSTSAVPDVVTVDPALITGWSHSTTGTSLIIYASQPQNTAVRFPPSKRAAIGSFLGDTAIPPVAASFPIGSPMPLGNPLFVYAREHDFFGRISPRTTQRFVAVNVP